MPGQLTEAEKAVRSEKMLELNQKRAKEYETSMLGKTLEILLEEEVEINGQKYLMGHSREYIKAVIPEDNKYKVNDLVQIRAEALIEEHILLGKCSCIL